MTTAHGKPPKSVVVAECIIYLVCAIGLLGSICPPPRASILIGVVIVWFLIALAAYKMHRGSKTARGWYCAFAVAVTVAEFLSMPSMPIVASVMLIAMDAPVAITFFTPSAKRFFNSSKE